MSTLPAPAQTRISPSAKSNARRQSPLSLNSKHPTSGAITGIDLGIVAGKLVAARWNKNSSAVVTNAHCLPWSSSIFSDAKTLASTLLEWLNEYGNLQATDVALSLPSLLVDQETIEIPADIDGTNQAALSSFAKDSVLQILGTSANNAIYDGWTSTTGGLRNLHLVWTDRTYTRTLVQTLAASGWFCRAIEVAPVALVRAAHGDRSEYTSQLIVDLSGSNASFIWSENGQSKYLRKQILLSQLTPAELVANQFNVHPLEAEVLLETVGIQPDEQGMEMSLLPNKLLSAVHSYLQALSYEIGRTRQYLGRLQANQPLQEIVLCGGVGRIAGLSSWLEAHLGIQVRLAAQTEGLIWNAATPFTAQFAVATALAYAEVCS